MRTAIVTDSTSYIPKEVRDSLDIHMLPLNVIFGDASYQEEVEITAEQFFLKVREQKELPKTSQPAYGTIIEKFEQLSKEYEAVVAITLSSGISGTYQSIVSAGSMIDNLEVVAYDSEISCMVQGFYVIEAAKMAKNGAGPTEIIERLDEIKQSADAYFMVFDLDHLQRGGRLSSAQAFVGSLLQVKPILTFVDKQIVAFEKIRTEKKAMKRITDLFGEVASKGEKMKAVVIHSNREDDAKKLAQQLSETYPNVEIETSYFGPVIGTHLGEGALGLGWYVV
ncbi:MULTISPECIES: DegV family protein [Bacillaceae]|uniref:Fatty acid-binding protein DegV n=1 Tax=Gottfriedia luciferensis TaxID=178774 RepID=A0ABX2ZQL3_9BACI|nr:MULTISPECIES: DegV family protein [Bacillaceae]ODG92033.1 fatty acid-binding protein DegV [Gottfriedia luciferensis]PGZ87022.1 DegV family protein [Bacillus sp. AFS029533]